MGIIEAFGFCKNHCKRPVYTQEQVIALIQAAINEGSLENCTGDVLISKIQETNKNMGLKFWVGTQAEYNALTTKSSDTHYIISDDNTISGMNAAIAALQAAGSVTTEKIANGAVTAEKLAPGAIPQTSGLTHTSETKEITITGDSTSNITAILHFDRYTTGDDDGGIVFLLGEFTIESAYEGKSKNYTSIFSEPSIYAPSREDVLLLLNDIEDSGVCLRTTLVTNQASKNGGFDLYTNSKTRNEGSGDETYNISVAYYGTPKNSL